MSIPSGVTLLKMSRHTCNSAILDCVKQIDDFCFKKVIWRKIKYELCNKNYTLANTYSRANTKRLVALFIEILWLSKSVGVEVKVEKTNRFSCLFSETFRIPCVTLYEKTLHVLKNNLGRLGFWVVRPPGFSLWLLCYLGPYLETCSN